MWVLRRVAAVEKAEAQKIQVVKAAEADAEAKFLQGQVRNASSRPHTEALSTERVPAESRVPMTCLGRVWTGTNTRGMHPQRCMLSICMPQGIARQRQAIVNGLRESVLNFSSDVNGARHGARRALFALRSVILGSMLALNARSVTSKPACACQ